MATISRGSKTAWMLRQGGDAFSCMHHFYVMEDDDLSSEAEVAAFIISTKSKDQELAKQVLDAWMALLIENEINYDANESQIAECITECIKKLPYSFQYPLSMSTLLSIHSECNNYRDVDTLYEYIDRLDLQDLHTQIKLSLNQQFCRVRFGGQYNTYSGTRELWFRISSTGYNWADDIYVWTANHYKALGVQSIYICRDYESDNGEVEGKEEYFYKAKDGYAYRNMPIYDYLSEEHEHSPVFSSMTLDLEDVLQRGYTYYEIQCSSKFKHLYQKGIFGFMIYREKTHRCMSEIIASKEGNPSTRTQMRMNDIKGKILMNHPDLTGIEIEDILPRENKNGKLTASEIIFRTLSDIPELNDLKVSIILPRGFKDTPASDVARRFRIEWQQYKRFQGIVADDIEVL